MTSQRRLAIALAVCAFVALGWLNQGITDAAWRNWKEQPTLVSAVKTKLAIVYRRAPDEELYFAAASAILGQPYDRTASRWRGDTPLPELDVPADGHVHVPYREVPLEYPPPNLPPIVLPRLLVGTYEAYVRVFGALMGLVLIGAAWLAVRRTPDRDARMLAFALLLLAHGAIAIQRLDALVALLVILIVDAGRKDDDRMLGFWSGLVGATKILPIVIGIVVLVATGTRDPRRWLRAGIGAVAGLALGILPQVLLAPDSIVLFLRYHGARGLHVESTLGVLYGAGKALVGHRERGVLDYGSFNFHGGLADLLAKASPLVLVVLLGLVVRQTAIGRADRDTKIVLAALATTVALWLSGKVFSPQYLTWALPLVIALPVPHDWRRFAWLLGAVLVLSQAYYRGFYDAVYRQETAGIVTMLVRLGLLVALFALALRGSRHKIELDGASAVG